MIALDQFMQPDPAREESVPVGPVPIRNYPLARMTALETVAKYGFCLHSPTRSKCQYFDKKQGLCCIWNDGEPARYPTLCTGRRP